MRVSLGTMELLARLGDVTASHMVNDAKFVGTYRCRRDTVIQFHAISAPRLAFMPGVEVISEGNGLAVLLW